MLNYIFHEMLSALWLCNFKNKFNRGNLLFHTTLRKLQNILRVEAL